MARSCECYGELVENTIRMYGNELYHRDKKKGAS